MQPVAIPSRRPPETNDESDVSAKVRALVESLKKNPNVALDESDVAELVHTLAPRLNEPMGRRPGSDDEPHASRIDRDLLIEYTEVLNRFGIDSDEEVDFIQRHMSAGDDFVALADTTRHIKADLTDKTVKRPTPGFERTNLEPW